MRKKLFWRTSLIFGTQLATDEKVSMAKFQTDPTIIPGVMWNWKFRAQKDSPLSKFLRRISRGPFTWWTWTFGNVTYQSSDNFAGSFKPIGERKLFGVFPYIPSKFIRNVWGKVRKYLFWRTSPIFSTQLPTGKKVSQAKFHTDPKIIPGVMRNSNFWSTKRVPTFQSPLKDISSSFHRMDLNPWQCDLPEQR